MGFISELESFEGITANVVITFDELQKLAKAVPVDVVAARDDHEARIQRIRIALQPPEP